MLRLCSDFRNEAAKQCFCGSYYKGRYHSLGGFGSKSSGDKYDRAGTSYTITDVSYVGSGSKMTKYVGTQYSGEINVCYRFLTNKNASYSGMAIACREQLIRNSVLSTRTVTSSAHLPFALTILGTAQKAAADTSALRRLTRHTTFSICSRQKRKQYNRAILRRAWRSKQPGIALGSLNNKKLGGKKSFENLKQYITTQNSRCTAMWARLFSLQVKIRIRARAICPAKAHRWDSR